MRNRIGFWAPWIFALLLAIMLPLMALRLPPTPVLDRSAILVPIRPPLTRPDPNEALLLGEKTPDTTSLAKDMQKRHPFNDQGERSELLRHQITYGAYEIGRLLTTEQLLFVLSQRDRMERDFYVGRSYQELVEALRKRAKE